MFGTACAQQTVTYTNGENDPSPIVITAALNPITLTLSSGTATQSGAISDSGTTGNVDVNAGTGTITLANANTYTGNTTIDFGTLAVTGTGGAINSPNGTIYAGDNNGDNGALLVSNGALVNDSTMYLGYSQNSVGAATVTGNGSTLKLFDLEVGQSGAGSLTIADGGQVTNNGTSIGRTTTALGSTLTVSGVNASGTASTLSVVGDIYDGNQGNGSLQILNGGQVMNDGNGIIGNGAPSVGSATVSGVNVTGTVVTPSTWNVGQTLYVGDYGNGTLTISNGGQVTSGGGYVGLNSISVGMATVTGVSANGTASTWSMGANTLEVGIYGSGTLSIINGGLVSDGAGLLGIYQGGTGNVLVSGVDAASGKASTWNNSFAVGVGVGYSYSPYGYGGSGTLTVANGGVVTAPEIVVAGGIQSNDGIANGGAASGVINVNSGGILEAGRIVSGVGSGAALNLNGGILQATNSYSSDSSGPYTTFISGFSAGQITVQSGGGTINNGGLSINISSPFGGTGALTYTGTGTTTLTSANSNSGGTTIANGVLALASGASLDQAGAVTANGTFDISQAGTQTIVIGDLLGTGTVALGSNALVVGTANNTTFSGALIDGGIGGGNGGILQKYGTGTLTLTGNNTYSGGTGVDFGTLAVSGTGGAIIQPFADMFAGYNQGDNGTLLISNGGTVENTLGIIGDVSGSTGTATVAGVNANGTSSTWDNNVTSFVGYKGNGTLSIQDGGQVYDLYGIIGYYSGSVGNATVTGVHGNGGASYWSNSGALYVGYAGTGTLNIQDGGQVSNYGSYIGGDAGSNGSVTVTGVNSNNTPSTWTTYGEVAVGDQGAGTLTIQNGGRVYSGESFIGANAGGNGTVTVTGVNANGAASTWFGGNLYLGNDGTGVLTISDGGVVSVIVGSGTLTIAAASGSNGTLDIGNGALAGTLQAAAVNGGSGTAVVNFSETDASYTFAPQLTGSLSVTQTGSGTTVLTGANNYTGNTTIDFGTLALTGTGGEIDSPSGQINVGYNNGDNGYLLIFSGASVTSANLSLGYNAGAVGTASVTGVNANGTASTLSMGAADLVVGGGGSGTLSILNGGQVSDDESLIGVLAGSSGNVLVSGIDMTSGKVSTWNSSGALLVGVGYTGSPSYGGTGTLTVSQGGVVTAAEIVVAGGIQGVDGLTEGGASGGTINVNSGGILQAGRIFSGGGSGGAALNLNGGILQATDSYNSSAGATGPYSTFLSGFSVGQVTLLSGGGTIDTGTLSVTVASPIGGSGGLTKIGSGILTSTASNTYTGGTTISNGTLALGSGGSLYSAGAVQDNGGFDISQSANQTIGDLSGTGTVSLGSQLLTVGTANSTTFAGSIVDGGIGGGTGGSLAKQGSGTLTLTGSNSYTGGTTLDFGTLAVSGAGASITHANAVMFVGKNNGDNGTLLVSNGGQVTDSGGFVGYLSGSTGTATVAGVNANGTPSTWSNSSSFVVGTFTNGTLSVLDGGQVSSVSGEIGDATGSTGLVIVSGVNANGTASAWNLTGALLVGDNGTGTLTVSNGGQVTTQTGLNVGAYNTGSMSILSGGQVISYAGPTPTTNQQIGANAGSSGTVLVDGAGSTWTANGALYVGNGGSGTLTVQNNGLVQSGIMTLAANGGTGLLNLSSGGVLAAPQVAQGLGSSAAINFNGGILRATANSSDFISNFSSGEVTLQSGGGTIDSNGNTITVNTNLVGVGGLTKAGAGTLTLTSNNVYAGPTTISNGALSVNSITAIGSAQPLGENNTVDFTGASALAPGALQYTGGTVNVNQNLTVASGAYGVVDNTGVGVMTLSGNISKDGGTFGLAGGNFIVSAAITGASPNSDLDIGSSIYPGSATVALTSANSYNGPTVITQGSSLLTGVVGALPTSTPSAVTLGSASDTVGQINTLDLLGHSQTVSALTASGPGTNQVTSSNGTAVGTPAIGTGASSSRATLTVNYSGSTTDTYSGSLGDTSATRLANNLGFIKEGSGTVALTNANTYTGGTAVNHGTLLLQNGANGSATGSGALTVASGATIGGAGTSNSSTFTINGNVLVGNGTDITSQTTLIGSSASFFVNANLTFNLGVGATQGESNILNLNSTPITFDNTTLTLNIAGLGIIQPDTIYTLISTNSIIDPSADGLTIGANGQITGGLSIAASGAFGNSTNGYTGGFEKGSDLFVSGRNIDVEVIPEPSTWALLLGGLGMLALFRLRSRRA